MTKKLHVTIVSLDGINPSYRVEWTENPGPPRHRTATCNVIKVNDVSIETEGLSLERNKELIDIIVKSKTKINIDTHPEGFKDPEAYAKERKSTIK